MNTYKIGYMTRDNQLVWRTLDAESVHDAKVQCMQEDANYLSCCYSECLTFKAGQ